MDLDLDVVKELLRTQLAHLLLETVPEHKDLVIDGALTKPLDRVAGITFLKKHGVDKIFMLDPQQKVLHGCERRVYLVRAKMTTMKLIADQITEEKNRGDRRSYTVVLVPRRLELCEMILELEGVAGDVTVEEFPLDLIPIDTDIMTLEMPDFFKSFYVDGEQTWIHTVASSLVNLQNLFGTIPNVYCLGKGSKMAYDLMQTISGLTGLGRPDQYKIGQLILVDRDIDYVTPLCSPMTYEALLDEVFRINCGVVDFGPEVTNSDKTIKQLLTSKDVIYAQIRNRHFSNVFAFLSESTKELQSGYDKKKDLKTVGDMKDFVSNDLKDLKQSHRALTQHIGACEAIMKRKKKDDFEEYIKAEHSILEGIEARENISYIEERIHKQAPMLSTLKLLCLMSLTQDGIPSSTFSSLTAQYLQSHGFEQMLGLFNLRRLGLLQETSLTTTATPLPKGLSAITKSSQFRTISKKLGLVPKSAEEINLKSPNDMSYVYSGAYTPLLCKLVEQILEREGLFGIEDILKNIPGGFFKDVKVKTPKGKDSSMMRTEMKTILVYFLGGCTYTEIAALRYLARTAGNWRILIATTGIITGNSFLESILES